MVTTCKYSVNVDILDNGTRVPQEETESC